MDLERIIKSKDSEIARLVRENAELVNKLSDAKRRIFRNQSVRPVDRYDGSGDWLDYKTHFRVVSKANGWSYDEMALELSCAVKGDALSVLTDMPGSEREDFESIVHHLEQRFDPASQGDTFLNLLEARRKNPNETLSQLGQDIKRLSNRAYSKWPHELRMDIALNQFYNALEDTDMRKYIENRNPHDIDEAVGVGLEYESDYGTDDHQKGLESMQAQEDPIIDTQMGQIVLEFKELKNTFCQAMEHLASYTDERHLPKSDPIPTQNNLAAFAYNYPKPHNHRIKCFNCTQYGHVIAECPKPIIEGSSPRNLNQNWRSGNEQ